MSRQDGGAKGGEAVHLLGQSRDHSANIPLLLEKLGRRVLGGGTITARQVQVTHDAEVILELTPALVRLKLKDGWLTILSERKKLSPTSFWTFVLIEQEAASPVSTARFAHTVSSTLVH